MSRPDQPNLSSSLQSHLLPLSPLSFLHFAWEWDYYCLCLHIPTLPYQLPNSTYITYIHIIFCKFTTFFWPGLFCKFRMPTILINPILIRHVRRSNSRAQASIISMSYCPFHNNCTITTYEQTYKLLSENQISTSGINKATSQNIPVGFEVDNCKY